MNGVMLKAVSLRGRKRLSIVLFSLLVRNENTLSVISLQPDGAI